MLSVISEHFIGACVCVCEVHIHQAFNEETNKQTNNQITRQTIFNTFKQQKESTTMKYLARIHRCYCFALSRIACWVQILISKSTHTNTHTDSPLPRLLNCFTDSRPRGSGEAGKRGSGEAGKRGSGDSVCVCVCK